MLNFKKLMNLNQFIKDNMVTSYPLQSIENYTIVKGVLGFYRKLALKI